MPILRLVKLILLTFLLDPSILGTLGRGRGIRSESLFSGDADLGWLITLLGYFETFA